MVKRPKRLLDISDMPNFNSSVKDGLHSVTEGKVFWFRQENGIETVYYKEHGACLCLNKDMTIWRCPTCHEGAFVEW
jgi:hypothetical protein